MPSERTSRRSGASFSSPVGACSSARRCGQSVGVQRDGMIDYALAGGPGGFSLFILFFARRVKHPIKERRDDKRGPSAPLRGAGVEKKKKKTCREVVHRRKTA